MYLFAVELKLVAADAREADGNSEFVLEVLQGAELVKGEAAFNGVEFRVVCRLVQRNNSELSSLRQLCVHEKNYREESKRGLHAEMLKSRVTTGLYAKVLMSVSVEVSRV